MLIQTIETIFSLETFTQGTDVVPAMSGAMMPIHERCCVHRWCADYHYTGSRHTDGPVAVGPQPRACCHAASAANRACDDLQQYWLQLSLAQYTIEAVPQQFTLFSCVKTSTKIN